MPETLELQTTPPGEQRMRRVRTLLHLAGLAFAFWLLATLLNESSAAAKPAHAPAPVADIVHSVPAPVEPAVTAVHHAAAPVARKARPVVRPVVHPVLDRVVRPAMQRVVRPTVRRAVHAVLPPVRRAVAPLVHDVVQPVVKPVVHPVVNGVVGPVVSRVHRNVERSLPPVLRVLHLAAQPAQHHASVGTHRAWSAAPRPAAAGVPTLGATPRTMAIPDGRSGAASTPPGVGARQPLNLQHRATSAHGPDRSPAPALPLPLRDSAAAGPCGSGHDAAALNSERTRSLGLAFHRVKHRSTSAAGAANRRPTFSPD